MKKFLMAVMLFCGAVSGFAQSKGDFRIGPTVGMNVAKVTDLDADFRIGFNVGAQVDYGITNNVFLSSGLILSQKGYEVDYFDDGFKVEEKGTPLYLSIPINIGYRYSLGNVVSIFGQTGPYLAFGVGGKEKVEVANVEAKEDYFGDDMANVFDMGWGVRLGVEANRFQVHLGYEYGFTKVVDDTSCHNSNFTIGVSYMF